MTCQDCIHHNICYYAGRWKTKDSDGEKKIIAETNNVEDTCGNFSDRSIWVKLPCKVGDMLYKITYSPCHLGETHPDSYGCSGCYDKCDIKLTVTEVTAHSTRHILDNIMPYIGKTVFLTREDAERVLKERESNER